MSHVVFCDRYSCKAKEFKTTGLETQQDERGKVANKIIIIHLFEAFRVIQCNLLFCVKHYNVNVTVMELALY